MKKNKLNTLDLEKHIGIIRTIKKLNRASISSQFHILSPIRTPIDSVYSNESSHANGFLPYLSFCNKEILDSAIKIKENKKLKSSDKNKKEEKQKDFKEFEKKFLYFRKERIIKKVQNSEKSKINTIYNHFVEKKNQNQICNLSELVSLTNKKHERKLSPLITKINHSSSLRRGSLLDFLDDISFNKSINK